ncbi:hypothetical protein LOC67_27075, partial [Stieleria sp. JC731]|uniref:hypothetical protein n=1 Tax=Stieleria sp. JC731 TaxID=2894195 RepID=UPI001E5695A2
QRCDADCGRVYHANHDMNRSDGVGVSEAVCNPPSLGYVRRYPTEPHQCHVVAPNEVLHN